ncbi:MAG: tetratricopeptide repeat protein [Vicingaceae bacterium]
MRTFVLLASIIFLLSSCSENKTQAQPVKEEYDIQPYLTKLDSAGYDITDDTLMFQVGYQIMYYGQFDKGNALIAYAMGKRDSVVAHDFQSWSVLNSKNGNYAIAIDKLEKAVAMDFEGEAGYYGWLLLYYYRDYEKALAILEKYDALTPNFSDAPMGEDIHYLKGLCQMQMNNHQIAVNEFDAYINNLATTHGEDFVDIYTFVQKGRCLTKLGKFEEAILSYKKAIKYYKNCSEAYYFMGLTQLEMNQKEDACVSLNTALNLIQKGFKSSDNYVEYFHEIYPQQIRLSLSESCPD